MNALMLLNIHKDLALNYDQLVDVFAWKKKTKNVASKSSRMNNFDHFSQYALFIKNLRNGHQCS